MLRQIGGYATIADPGRPLTEYDTASCAHCSAVIFTKPGTAATTYLIPRTTAPGLYKEVPGAFCRLCMKPVCLTCDADGRCLPLEARLGLLEGRKTVYRGLVLTLLLILAIASSASAQTSPDPTFGLRVVDAQLHVWTLTDRQLSRDGVLVGVGGDLLKWDQQRLYVEDQQAGSTKRLALDGVTWEVVQWDGLKWVVVSAPPPAPPPTQPPAPVVEPFIACLGESLKVIFTHPGTNTSAFWLKENTVKVQTLPVSGLVQNQGLFTLPAFTTVGDRSYTVSAVSSTGQEAISQPVVAHVGPAFTVSGIKWPAGNTGSRSGSWNSGTQALKSAAFLFNPLRFRAERIDGCTVTVTK